MAGTCAEVLAFDAGNQTKIVPQHTAGNTVLDEQFVAHVGLLRCLEDGSSEPTVERGSGIENALYRGCTTIPVHVVDRVRAVVVDCKLVRCGRWLAEEVELTGRYIGGWHAARPWDIAIPACLVNGLNLCAGHASQGYDIVNNVTDSVDNVIYKLVEIGGYIDMAMLVPVRYCQHGGR